MPGIYNLTVEQLQFRISRFDPSYSKDWEDWLNTPPKDLTNQFGSTMRRWQACRPNSMRRTRFDNLHEPPYLEDLMAMANLYLPLLKGFSIRNRESFSQKACDALTELWNIFKHLPYQGRARGGFAGGAGISKAVLLLTKGCVGPAFDSQVRNNLQIGDVKSPEHWISTLKMVYEDINQFEINNGITLIEAAPSSIRHLECGRIYDMALGPGIQNSLL